MQKANLCKSGQGCHHSIWTKWNSSRMHVGCWLACKRFVLSLTARALLAPHSTSAQFPLFQQPNCRSTPSWQLGSANPDQIRLQLALQVRCWIVSQAIIILCHRRTHFDRFSDLAAITLDRGSSSSSSTEYLFWLSVCASASSSVSGSNALPFSWK